MDNFKELDFIWEINQTISCNQTTLEVIEGLNVVCSNYLKTDSINIIYYDQQQNTLYKFQDFSIIENPSDISFYEKIYNQLKSTIRLNFILNDSFFVINDDFYMEHKIKLKKDKNVFYIPLIQNYNCIGFIEIIAKFTNESFIYKNIIKLLFIMASSISSFVTNKILTKKITKIAHFYKAQKNIAKILETQYDYSFLIPVIGEILDNFANDYFSYIFMKNDNDEYVLSWPLRYDKNRIDPILQNIPSKNSILKYDKENIVLFPIYFDKHLKGVIIIDGKNKIISKEDIDLFMQLSHQIATTLDKASVYAEIEKFATKDALTNLNNRRSLETRIQQEVSMAKRKNTPLCVMMLDVDFFKKINDTYGHYVGDIILKEISNIINDEIREYDFPARYGGEEFFVIFPSTTIEEASLVANRLRAKIESTSFNIEKANLDTKELNATISIGLTSFDNDMDIKTLYLNADKALYTAKETGRNRVVIQ